jgi:Lon protease-like protein
MDSRYKIIDELQQIPYKVVRCNPFLDMDQIDGLAAQEKMRRHLDQLFIDLSANHANKDEMESYVKSEEWQRQSMEVYSFAIYSLVLFEPDVLQRVLELQSISARISFMIDTLSEKFLQ